MNFALQAPPPPVAIISRDTKCDKFPFQLSLDHIDFEANQSSNNMADLSQPMAADPAKHRDELFQRLDALRTKESFCDVTVAVKGKEFKVHKVVLHLLYE